MNIIERIDSFLVVEAVDWKEFYTMSKDTSGGKSFKEYEKKYGGTRFQMPHIRDALNKTGDFKGFMKAIQKFNEASSPQQKKLERKKREADSKKKKFKMAVDKRKRESEKRQRETQSKMNKAKAANTAR